MELKETIESLSDAALVSSLRSLRTRESEVRSDLLLHIAELDRRQSYRELGYSSTFAYLTQALGYSEGETYRRIAAARVLMQNPDLYGKIRDGKISLCALAEIAKIQEVSDQREVLTKAEGQSRREVKKLVVAKLPPSALKKERVVMQSVVAATPSQDSPSLFYLASQGTETTPSPAKVNYSVTLPLPEEVMAKLTEAKALVGAQTLVEAIEKLVDIVLDQRSPKKREERREKRKIKKAEKEAKAANAKQEAARKEVEKLQSQPETKKVEKKLVVTRHIPTPLRDRIVIRDGQRCTFVSADGRRCTETAHLEVDHVYPFGLRGEHLEENLRVLCRAPNQLMAEHAFGTEKIRSMRERKL